MPWCFQQAQCYCFSCSPWSQHFAPIALRFITSVGISVTSQGVRSMHSQSGLLFWFCLISLSTIMRDGMVEPVVEFFDVHKTCSYFQRFHQWFLENLLESKDLLCRAICIDESHVTHRNICKLVQKVTLMIFPLFSPLVKKQEAMSPDHPGIRLPGKD